VTSGDDKAILSECERGEDSRSTLTEIKSAHDRVKNLRDAAKKS